MPGSLVLLPTYNERENLPRVLPRLAALGGVDVLVIDDASPDGTGELAETLRERYHCLSVLHRIEKDGLGRAYVSGIEEALRRGYRRIVTMDADLSHSPEDVPRLLRALDDADVALGSRHVPGGGVSGWPIGRRILSRLGSLYARTLLGLPVRDVTGGFRAYRAEALEAIDLAGIRSRGFSFQIEMLRRILDLPGARASEVPIIFANRSAGVSKLSAGIVGEAIRAVVELRRPTAVLGPRRRLRDDELPLVSVIVPVREGAGEPAALPSIRAQDYPVSRLEVLVARGANPSAQRNRAARESRGEILVFLDDDSEADPGLVRAYAEAFAAWPRLAAAGGPALPRPETNLGRRLALIAGEPWAIGRSAARYRGLGVPRASDESELILCNLALRRSVFLEMGGLDESLYPNEENELLERLRLAGAGCLYEPQARVHRREARPLGEYLRAIHRYGRGRAEQTRALPSRGSLLRVAGALGYLAMLVLGAVGAALGEPLLAAPLGVYATYLAGLWIRLARRASVLDAACGAGLAAMTHASYALGLAQGLLSKRKRPGRTCIRIERPALGIAAARQTEGVVP